MNNLKCMYMQTNYIAKENKTGKNNKRIFLRLWAEEKVLNSNDIEHTGSQNSYHCPKCLLICYIFWGTHALDTEIQDFNAMHLWYNMLHISLGIIKRHVRRPILLLSKVLLRIQNKSAARNLHRTVASTLPHRLLNKQ